MATSPKADLTVFPAGSVEFMEYVADSKIPPSETLGEKSYLCHLVKQWQFLTIPVLNVSEGYVLGYNHCTSIKYHPFLPEELATYQAVGLLPRDIPPTPSLRFELWVPGIATGSLFAIYMIAAVVHHGRSARKEATRITRTFVSALCHAARSDGDVDTRRLQTIADITEQLTGIRPEASRLRQAVNTSNPNLTAGHFVLFSFGLSQQQKDMMMEGVLMVLGTGRPLSNEARKFVYGLAGGLGFTRTEAETMLANHLSENAA